MTPIGQTYRASGPINFRSVASTLILGTFTAVLSALAVWAWEISPIPTLIIFTPLIQGLLIGVVLAFAIGRLRMRNPRLLLMMGFSCGLASVAMVHLFHHVELVNDLTDQCRVEVRADDGLTPEQKKEVLAMLDEEPEKLTDHFLMEKTGHSGLIGSVILRSRVGVTIKNVSLTGWGLGALWIAEALMVAFMAATWAGARAAEPFCDDCGEWFHKVSTPLLLPGEAGEQLADAIRNDDPAKVADLGDNPPKTAGSTFSGVTLYACHGCDQTYADIWRRTDTMKRGSIESSTHTLQHFISISPIMTALLLPEKAEESTDAVADSADLAEVEAAPEAGQVDQ